MELAKVPVGVEHVVGRVESDGLGVHGNGFGEVLGLMKAIGRVTRKDAAAGQRRKVLFFKRNRRGFDMACSFDLSFALPAPTQRSHFCGRLIL